MDAVIVSSVLVFGGFACGYALRSYQSIKSAEKRRIARLYRPYYSAQR